MNLLLQKIMFLNNTSLLFSGFMTGLAVLLIIIIINLEDRRKLRLANKLPGPDGWFLVGMLPIVLQGPELIIKKGLQLYREYEKTLFKIWICNNLYVFITKPEEIEAVLTNPKLQKKAKEYVVLQESIMGQGIFSVDNIKQWKSNRKMVSAGFSFTIIKSLIPIFNEEAQLLSKILQEKRDTATSECEISHPVSMATMEMIGRSAFGVHFNAQKGGKHKFVENLIFAMMAWEYRVTHPWFLSKTLFQFSPVKHRHDRSQKIINEFTDDIIRKKINELGIQTDNVNHTESDKDDIVRKPKSLIEILIENYHGMTHNQIRDEIVTVTIGGQETTAFANACTIFMLAHHQDVQNKLYEELEGIFSIGDPERQATYEDLQQMEYLERVIKESLRICPPLPVFGRSLEEDMKIGEHLIPAGASLVISPICLHSSPRYYKDPEKFNPDNFLPEACHSRHPYAFIPFSAGYRNCIGIKYGMLQMKTVVSTLVRKNRFFPSDKCPTPQHLRLMFLSTLKFVDNCYIKIEPRT